MKILIAGLPGSGKTTQASKVSEYLNICFITTGDTLRELSKENSAIGQKVREAVESGQLVDDTIVAEVIKHKTEKPECEKGFVMDGYPRTVHQLELFDPEFEKVFYLNVSIDEAKRRLFSRGRVDDKQEVIENRFLAQKEKLMEIVNYYKDKGLLIEINGEQDVETISNQIEGYIQ